MTEPDWIDDYCDDGNTPADETHARGLVKLHAACTPPCPRKVSAQRWLPERGQGQGTESDVGL
ncbi:hypothetical protein [Nocardia sp. R7R-8]|uniref:hypothetical protein n=1 Tax=Nocardia sp. R7R-8 TaxID=3459304 RepID=UPI00403D9257